MSLYARHYQTRQTPQSQPVPGKPMVPNSAGGHAFAVDKWQRLERFLVLGSAGGSYYASERALTVENCEVVRECLADDAARTVQVIAEISDAGRAPKNDPAIFALAMAAGMGHTALAMEALPRVVRIGTHLFQFVEAVQGFRGWGRGLRKGLAAWYTGRAADALAYQIAKYQQRNGWSHRDVLRLTHPTTDDPARDAALRWAVGGTDALKARTVKRGERATEYPDRTSDLPRLLAAMEEAKTADAARLCRLIREDGLPRECIPTEHLNAPEVWESLLVGMPLQAMVRNLGKMSAVGLLKPFSEASKTVCSRLSDIEYIRRSRLHPMTILMAARTYAAGRGLKGSLSWTVVPQIVDALDGAFYLAFANVEPSGKRTLLCLDVSGSMGSQIGGTFLTCSEASAAMALVTARTEPQYAVMAFAHEFRPLDITARDRLGDAMAKTRNQNYGGTDCALPMLWAAHHGVLVDLFTVYTDSETWFGQIHPFQALAQYRQKTGIPARLAVAAMASNGFSIADPSDPGMLDVVGFDTTVPAVLADFAKG